MIGRWPNSRPGAMHAGNSIVAGFRCYSEIGPQRAEHYRYQVLTPRRPAALRLWARSRCGAVPDGIAIFRERRLPESIAGSHCKHPASRLLSMAAKKRVILAGGKGPLVWLRNGLEARDAERWEPCRLPCGNFCWPTATARSVARPAGSIVIIFEVASVSQEKSSFSFSVPELAVAPRAGVRMTLPGETEAGSAGMQPCRGITWWAHRDDERSAEASLLRSSRDHIGSVDPDALKIPARRAERLFNQDAPKSPLTATEHWRRGPTWSRQNGPIGRRR